MEGKELVYIRTYIINTGNRVLEEHPHIKQADSILQNSPDSILDSIFPGSSKEITYMVGEQNAYLG